MKLAFIRKRLILVFLGLSTSLCFDSGFSYAQDSSTVSDIARQITVRIEGATQGSGVLIGKDDNLYTLLTAFHVLSPNKPGEEVVAVSSTGKEYALNISDAKRIYQTDLALITFRSDNNYLIATTSSANQLTIDEPVVIAGFPIYSPSKLSIKSGLLQANAKTSLSNGYQLVYNNSTFPGMSGGPILSEDGFLIGIHGRGEKDSILSQISNSVEKTGFNQGMPIDHYIKYLIGSEYDGGNLRNSPDSYIAQAAMIVSTDFSGSEQTVLRLLTEAEKYLERSSQISFLKSLVYNNLGQHELALRELRVCIENDEDNFKFHLNMGTTLGHLGRKKESAASSKKAIELITQQTETEYSSVIGLIQASINYAIMVSTTEQYNEALFYLDNTAKLVKSFGLPKLELKYLPVILFRIGYIANEMNNINAAEDIFKNSISIKDNYLARNALAKLYLGMRKTDMALAQSKVALSLNPRDKFLYQTNARILMLQGDFSGAIQQLDKSLLLDPNYVSALNLKLRILRKSGDFNSAMNLINQSLQIDSNQAFVYHERALIYQSANDFNRALYDYNKAISIDSSKAPFYGNKFTTLVKLGRTTEALKAINIAISLNKKDPVNYSKRAVLKLIMNDKPSACDDLDMAFSLGDTRQASLITDLCS